MPVGADGRGAARCRLALVLGVVVLVSISLAFLVAGTAALGMRDSLRALAALLVGGDAGATATLVLLGVRVPRVVSGACCGAALSCAGTGDLNAMLKSSFQPISEESVPRKAT